MKKIATITFHASYNYGSSLQAYALQEAVKQICNNNCKYEIINLRTDKQKYMYSIKKGNNFLASLIRKIMIKNYNKNYIAKNAKFEEFIQNKLELTKEYNSLEELQKQELDYDYYISGSDQLWNLRAYDFDWAYFLGFTTKGKKISYAASFGPKEIQFTKEEKEQIKQYIEEYKQLSVREEGSYNNIYQLTGKKPQINMDPTILLEKKEWEKLIAKEKIQKGEYILYYSLGATKEDVAIVKKIAKKLKLPVITTLYNGRNELFSAFKQVYNVGPLEFLNLLYYSKLVLTTSFHATIFSIIFNKPFFSINGQKDYRRSTLLQTMNLMNRSINEKDLEMKIQKAYQIDFEKSNAAIEIEREKSTKYLKEALDIKIL